MSQSLNSEFLKQLFDHVTESIIVVNESGEITLVNPAAEKLFGYTLGELKGKTIEFLIPARLSKKHEEHRKNYNENPHSRSMGMGMDLLAVKKDKSEFPVEVSLSPFRTDSGTFVIAFILDITRRKAFENDLLAHKEKLEKLTSELKVSNEKLEMKVQDRTKVLQEALTEIEKSRVELSEALDKEKELNELKSRFLSMASHEFRTPLTTILSSAALISEYPDTAQQDKRLKHTNRIKSAVNNMNNILGDFLSLSKIEEGKVGPDFQQFDLSKLAGEVRNEMQGISKAGQLIEWKHQGDVIVFLDPKLIRNILINLLSNAIKFSAENKRIVLQTSVDEETTAIRVIDEGIGISEEDQSLLFQRFFRGSNASNIQGTGLGLNIVSKYVELMNGLIEISSELDKGTEVLVTFKNTERIK